LTVILGPMKSSGWQKERTTVMKKPVRNQGSKPRPSSKVQPIKQRSLQLPEIMVGAHYALHEVVVEVGQQVLLSMLEQDRDQLCGAKGRWNPDRSARRHGRESGHVVLGGRKISVNKPRVRTIAGEEVRLPTWEQFRNEDPLDARTAEQMLIGVSTRKYERSLEGLPAGMDSIAVKKSSVSRRFIKATQGAVEAFLTRSLKDLEFPVLMIDGKHVGDHLLLFVLGFDQSGQKQVLGVWEGSTESYEVCKSLLRDLIERGLVVEQPRLIVIDGGKGIHKAVSQVFGQFAVIQRCQVHKLRNVLEHLPEKRRAWVKVSMVQAWKLEDKKKAWARFQQLIQSLQEDHPGAASSLEEGLAETMALIELGITDPQLRRTFRSTNPIENLNSTVERLAKRVTRWKSASMARRWAVAVILEAEPKFRRIQGYQQMPRLIAALEAKTKHSLEKVA
jgi:putative transposase